jgi:hypothetical protein
MTVLAAAVAAVSLVIATSADALRPSPITVYRALFTTFPPESQLPRGFGDPAIGSSTPSGNALKHGAIGGQEVLLFFNSADALVSYIVFPSRAEALAYFADVKNGPRGNRAPTAFHSLPKPVRLFVNRDGTDVTLVDGNVRVGVSTRTTAESIALTRFAVRHLEQMRRVTRARAIVCAKNPLSCVIPNPRGGPGAFRKQLNQAKNALIAGRTRAGCGSLNTMVAEMYDWGGSTPSVIDFLTRRISRPQRQSTGARPELARPDGRRRRPGLRTGRAMLLCLSSRLLWVFE